MESVQLFCRLSTQWKWIVGAKAMRCGLDYAGVVAFMNVVGLSARTELFEDIQVMETAALQYWHEKS